MNIFPITCFFQRRRIWSKVFLKRLKIRWCTWDSRFCFLRFKVKMSRKMTFPFQKTNCLMLYCLQKFSRKSNLFLLWTKDSFSFKTSHPLISCIENALKHQNVSNFECDWEEGIFSFSIGEQITWQNSMQCRQLGKLSWKGGRCRVWVCTWN